MRAPVYGVRSHKHLGDSVITAGAVHNVKLAHPELRFKYVGWAPEIWENNPDVEGPDVAVDVELPLIDYGSVSEERRASRGNVVKGFTRSLCKALGIDMVKMVPWVPYVVLTDEERRRASKWRGFVLLNANGQTVSISKCYPYWQKVVDELKDAFPIVQVGSLEKRNISPTLVGVLDMRGKTENIRDLLCMVYGCRGVISPPSGIVNIAAAFGKKAVVVNGARELDRLTCYPNMEHVSHYFAPCQSGKSWACIALTLRGLRPCVNMPIVGGIRYSGCMEAVDPQRIIVTARRLLA